MEQLTGVQDLDERIAALRAEVQVQCIEGREFATLAAADAVAGPVARWLNGPVTPAFERGARLVALVVGGLLPVATLVVVLILAA